MKNIIIVLRLLVSNWLNYISLSVLIFLYVHIFLLFEIINDENSILKESSGNILENIINAPLENIIGYILFPLLVLIPFTFGYFFFQFLIDIILFFAFKFSIKKTIKIENYIFILIVVVAVIFRILIHFFENNVGYHEIIIYLLIGSLTVFLFSFTFISTQKIRTKWFKK